MSFFQKLTARLTRKAHSDRTRATPDDFAAAVVTAASSHYNSLRRCLSNNGVRTRGGIAQITETQWAQASAELLRAYFGLASLQVANFLQDSDLSSLYGWRMIDFLRHYPAGKVAWDTAFVRELFADSEALESAISSYVRGQLTQEDSAAIEEDRTILKGSHASEPPGLILSFCLTLQVRLSRHLGIRDRSADFLDFVYVWIETIGGITSIWNDAFSKVEPIFADRAAA